MMHYGNADVRILSRFIEFEFNLYRILELRLAF